jgi:hypothetical protein
VFAAQGPDWGDAVAEALSRPAAATGWAPHGLPLLEAGALAAALLAFVVNRRRLMRGEVDDDAPGRGAIIAFFAYVSHWIADLFTGYKPTWPGGPVVGLGWYSHPRRDFALESLVVVAGWILWRRSLPDARGKPLAWALLAALLALQAAADAVMWHGTLFT